MKISNNIIIFSTADWETKPWTNKQRVAMHLSERNYNVLYIDTIGLRTPKLSGVDMHRIFIRLLKGIRGIRKIKNNLWNFSPLTIPYQKNRWIRKLNNLLLNVSLKIALKRIAFESYTFWIYNPLSVALIDKLKPESIIYHCVDDLNAIPGIQNEALARKEKDLINRSDLIFSTSPVLHRKWQAIKPENSFYLPNVANFKLFNSATRIRKLPSEITAIPNPRIGYIGTLSDYKIDFEMILNIARLKPKWQWVLIGGEREGQHCRFIDDLKRLPNVHFLGYRAYKQLPNYLAGFDVATLPIKHNKYTQAMFPMKFFEYLCAEVPVVATSIPSLQAYRQACFIADGHNDSIIAIDRILNGNKPDEAYCRNLAMTHTYEWRMNQMLKIISRHKHAN